MRGDREPRLPSAASSPRALSPPSRKLAAGGCWSRPAEADEPLPSVSIFASYHTPGAPTSGAASLGERASAEGRYHTPRATTSGAISLSERASAEDRFYAPGAAGANAATSLGERASADVSKRLVHADLIARAREVARETVDAIERAKTLRDHSRNELSLYPQAELSRPSRDARLARADAEFCSSASIEPRATLAPASLALTSTDYVEPHSGVLPSTLAVQALRASEPARVRMSVSSFDDLGRELRSPRAVFGPAASVLPSPRASPSRPSLSPRRAETHPDLHWGATALTRPLHSRDQLWSPRINLNVTAYPPSPEDGLHHSMHASVPAAPSGGLALSTSLSALGANGATRRAQAGGTSFSPRRGYGEAWSPRDFSAPTPVSPEYGLSPRPRPGGPLEHRVLSAPVLLSPSPHPVLLGDTVPGSRLARELCTGRGELLTARGAGIGQRSLWEMPESWGKA